MKKLSLLIICAGALMFNTHARAQTTQTDPSQQMPPSQSQAQTQSWNGTLVDADCKASTPNAKCEVSDTTKSFGLQTSDGNYVRFDDTGNAKVRSALDNASKKTGRIKASISGSMSGDMVTIDTVTIH